MCSQNVNNTDKGLRLVQPYAQKVLEGEISVLLRPRSTNTRGRVFVLTSKNPDKEEYPQGDIDTDRYPLGKAIGTIEISDCQKFTKEEISKGKASERVKREFENYPPNLLPDKKKIAVWYLEAPEKFKNPKPYQSTPSLSLMVQNVELQDKELPEIQEAEKTTMWDFGKADRSPPHDLVDFHGWYPPQIPRNCIKRYARNEDAIVLDCFVGSGTTLIECERLGKKGIGIDINPKIIEIAKEKLECAFGDNHKQIVKVGNAKNITEIPEIKEVSGEIDSIITHPPYWNAIEYSREHGEPIPEDFSLDKTVDEFEKDMRKVFKQMFQVLKPGGYCCVTIGDIGEGGFLVPLGFYLTQIGLDEGFRMKDIAIWILKGERSIRESSFRRRYVEAHNNLLIKHNYVLIFQKPRGN